MEIYNRRFLHPICLVFGEPADKGGKVGFMVFAIKSGFVPSPE
jgi:hypothetical protein